MTPVAESTISRGKADEIIARSKIPRAILGTQAKTDSDWCFGDTRDLRHDHWKVKTGDKRRDGPLNVHFDPVVDVDGAIMGAGDVLTKKQFVLAWLAGTTGRKRASASRLLEFARSFDWIVRHRLSLRVECFRDAKVEHYRDLIIRTTKGSLLALVPIERRAAVIGWDWAGLVPELDGKPDSAPGGASIALGVSALARKLGVTSASLNRRPGGNHSRPISNAARGSVNAAPATQAGDPGMNIRTLTTLLSVWKDIAGQSRNGRLEHDPLSFDPLGGTTVDAVACQHGAPASYADAVSPVALLRWLRSSEKIVREWAEPLISAIAAYHRLEERYRYSSVPIGRRVELSLRLDAVLPAGMPKLWLAWQSHPNGKDPRLAGRSNLTEVTSHLMTACLVSIGSFAACGVDDVLELKPGAVIEPSPDLFELVIGKDDPLGPRRVIPFPAIGAMAFRALLRLTEPTRAAYGGDSLFRVAWSMPATERARIGTTRYTLFPPKGYLKNFGATHGLPLLDQAGIRPVSGDQFQAGFSLAYVHGVPGASMEELCAFLGMHYFSDVHRFVRGQLPGRIAALRARIAARVGQASALAGLEAASDLLAVRDHLASLKAIDGAVDGALCRDFVERALRIADRSDVPGGRGGARIVRDVNDVIARVRADVVLEGSNDPDAERALTVPAMRALYRRHALMPLPGGHACCTFRAGRDDHASAECLVRRAAARRPWATAGGGRHDERPDYAHSGILPCLGPHINVDDGHHARLGCAHAAVFNRNRAIVAGVGDRLAADAARAPTPGSKAQANRLVADVMGALEASKPPKERVA